MGCIIRAIHDLGLAVWWGGSLMGTMSMNPAVEVLDDPDERAKMVDEGWALFQPWAAAGLASAIISHIIMRRNPPKRPSAKFKNVARIKDALYGVAVVSSVASMALGEYVIHQEADYSPIESIDDDSTFDNDEALQSSLTKTSLIQLAAGAGIFIAGAFLATEREK
jgi:uncharacterized membrane protein